MAARIFIAGEIIAWLFLSVALYFLALWALEFRNALSHEYLIGTGMALVFGSPFWLGTPAFAAWKRRELSKAQKYRAVGLVGVAAGVFIASTFGGA